MTAVIEFQSVRHAYPDGTQGLKDCSLALREGARTALLGPNGAGKTTFFLHCNGLLRPDSGRVLFRGSPMGYGRDALRSLRAEVGLVFQNPDAQLFSASVREDVSFGPMNLGLDRGEVVRRVDEALDSVGLAEAAGKPVHNLSYGQKKRVCIAGVLAMRPRVMILDEPTAGLDLKMQEDLLGVLARLHREGMTLVMATHDLDLAYAWSDEICLMEQGALAAHCASEAFPDQEALLSRLGFGLPQVARLHRLLSRKGIGAEGPAPRSFEALAGWLEGAGHEPR